MVSTTRNAIVNDISCAKELYILATLENTLLYRPVVNDSFYLRDAARTFLEVFERIRFRRERKQIRLTYWAGVSRHKMFRRSHQNK